MKILNCFTSTPRIKILGSVVGALLLSASSLAFAETDGTWKKIATENQSFNITGTQTVRYGAGTKWVSRSMTGNNHVCSNSMFGTDPVPGVVKVCQVFTANVNPSYNWYRVSAQNGTFNILGTKTVRYGADSRWKHRALSGNNHRCINARFGGDPAPGVPNTCEAWSGPAGTAPPPVSVTDPTPTPTHPPHTNGIGLLPSPYVGFSAGSSEVRSTYTGVRGSSDSNEAFAMAAFRTVCAPSHMLYDDPLVFPGQPGNAHLHVFFGNTAANANSTPQSIRTTGNSTCRGGILNRSSYWLPAVVDTRTNRAVVPRTANIYYKTGRAHFATISPIPQGLRMIAGDAHNSQPVAPWEAVGEFECLNNPSLGRTQTMPNCPAGDELIAQLTFPQCWDGVNTGSANNKSHMAYAISETGLCPASHPVALPEITILAHYEITSGNQVSHFKLSSDTYNGPGGYSMHGDFMMGWVDEAMNSFVANCLNRRLDCKSHLLGDGREIF